MNNSIFTIVVYKHEGFWVFDDDRVGLVKEPFVAGADTLIDKLAGEKERITLIFSIINFPGHKLTLARTNPSPEVGTDYTCVELNHDIWLCPALNLYYPVSPNKIYVDYKL